MSRISLPTLLLLVCPIFTFAQKTNERALTFNDFIALDLVSDPQISPDGEQVAFVVTDYSLKENRGNSDIWLVSVTGGQSMKLTQSSGGDSQPRWSSDSRRVFFVSDRDGTSQVYTIDVGGGEALKLSDVNGGVYNLIISSNDKWLAFSSEVEWPLADTVKDESYPTEAKIWTDLFYRHWNEWRAGTRSHLFLMPINGGPVRDLTPVDRDIPTLSLGGYKDITFSPDGQEIAFVMNPDSQPAVGTNNDVFLFSIQTGSTSNLTEDNLANDNNPLFSPDGTWIAYRAQRRAGFEADRYRLLLYNRATEQRRDLVSDWTSSIGEIAWSPDSQSLFATVQEQTHNVIYRIRIRDGKSEKILDRGHLQTLRPTPDGSTLVFTKESADQPDEIYAVDLRNRRQQKLSNINDELLSQLSMNPLESFSFKGALQDKVEGLLLKPPFFDASKKYPLVYLIHGGPQGAWQDNFHPRWNYQMFASPGYIVAMVNFHGSTGYGQEFTDSISQHWGDYPYEDIMKGLEYLVSNYSFIDANKVAAAGASYGGYMVNWIAGHTSRFTCLINHDGVFNLESMYGETEELWFPEWEFSGTPWDNRDLYQRWSPHRFAQNFETPMLIIHGQLDYRVDISQSLEAFTALRRQNIEGRFLYFPDEGHWVLKPRNRLLWWREVLAWLEHYLKGGA